ncbi:hypothetical protein BGX34_000929 [Mortierella sp. NVP85]|nr:hypothetical protein BGX34_000929 [Mortierella sp. NVP85]
MPLSEHCINGLHLPISLLDRTMRNGSESPTGSNYQMWKDEIEATRAGAGYFLSLKGRPEFDLLDYIAFRGLVWSEAQCLPREWNGWMQDMKTSAFEHVRRRALSAPVMTFQDVYNFYKVRIVDRHELEILEESSQQVVNGGNQLGSFIQERQKPEVPCRKRHATESETTHKTKSRKKVPNEDSKAAMHKAHTDSRIRRYKLLDKKLFWRLKSGRAVETVLHEASLQPAATTCICSYVIDVSCRTTKALFDVDEWDEILAKTRFDLPQLPRPTLLFLDRLRQSILQGQHPNYVPLPDPGATDHKDLADCLLAQKTAAEWHFLYHKEPSPFVVDDLSEAWWARESWAALHDLLNDLPSIFMVDGEKRGLDSSRRRNMGRQFNPEEPIRRRCGRKLDLICRDEQLLHDWMVIERMRHWDPQSTKLLKEFGCDVLHTGFGFIQLHPATEKSFVLVLERQKFYTLPRTKNNLQEPFKGLVKLLRIRTAVKSTIELYRQLYRAQHPPEDAAGQYQETDEADLTWMTEDPVGLFGPNIVVASSPLGPDDLSPAFDEGLPYENDGL